MRATSCDSPLVVPAVAELAAPSASFWDTVSLWRVGAGLTRTLERKRDACRFCCRMDRRQIKRKDRRRYDAHRSVLHCQSARSHPADRDAVGRYSRGRSEPTRYGGALLGDPIAAPVESLDGQVWASSRRTTASGTTTPHLGVQFGGRSLARHLIGASRLQTAGPTPGSTTQKPPAEPPSLMGSLLQSPPPTPLHHRRPATDHPTDQPPWTSHLGSFHPPREAAPMAKREVVCTQDHSHQHELPEEPENWPILPEVRLAHG